MNYNVDFEISALVFLLVVTCYFFIKRKYINLQGKIYAFYVIFVLFNIITNVFSVYLIDLAAKVPLWLNYSVNSIYMCCQLLIPAILLIYILSLSNLMKKSLIFVLTLPIIFGVVMILGNPFTDFFFYFNQIHEYTFGVGHSYLYINGVFYILTSVIIVIIYRKRIGATMFFTFIGIIMIMIGGMIYQLFNPQILITGTGSVISLIMLYITMENPDNYRDTLTSTLNEDALKSKLKTIYENQKSSRLIILSLSDFKLINNVFGRNLGDIVLKKVADYIVKICNKQDVFRINGDVFLILVNHENETYALMNQLVERFKSEWEANHINIRLACKFGLMSTADYIDHDELFLVMEYSVSEMKQNKDKNIYIVDKTEKAKMERNATIKRAIADIINKEQMEIFYQPIFYADGRIRALESLARMNLVKYGYIPPEEFIRISELNGMILQLGDVIIKEVIHFIEDYHEAFDKGMIVGINLSVIQVMSPSFAERILNLFHKHKIQGKNIVFEITESEAIYSDPTVIENLQQFKKMGIRFAMDDYGTGYANLNNMIEIAFSTIKIDKQVIWNAMNNQRARVILNNTVKMLLDLKYDIVAEGIETEAQLERMKRIGINLFQGYYFTKPVSRYEIWDELHKIKQRLAYIEQD